MKRVLSTIAVALLALACAGQQKQNFIHERAGEYVYEQNIDKIWPQVGEMLKEQGFTFKEDRARHQLVTEWKEEMGSSSIAASWTRYHVIGTKLDDAHCRIHFQKYSMSKGGGSGAYDSSAARHNAAAAMGGVSPEGGRANASAAAAGVGPAGVGAAGARGGSAGGARDLNAEWLLIQRIAPDDARELQAEADAQFR